MLRAWVRTCRRAEIETNIVIGQFSQNDLKHWHSGSCSWCVTQCAPFSQAPLEGTPELQGKFQSGTQLKTTQGLTFPHRRTEIDSLSLIYQLQSGCLVLFLMYVEKYHAAWKPMISSEYHAVHSSLLHFSAGRLQWDVDSVAQRRSKHPEEIWAQEIAPLDCWNVWPPSLYKINVFEWCFGHLVFKKQESAPKITKFFSAQKKKDFLPEGREICSKNKATFMCF